MQAESNRYVFTLFAASIVLLFVNGIAAFTAPILDCDEVYNYWEPIHYLLHGNGMQTWEYSPQYALRSWLYVLPHALVGKLASLVGLSEKIKQFYVIRCVLALICTACQHCLLAAVTRQINVRVAIIMALIMASATGPFYAGVALLPSSFSMYMGMLGLAKLLDVRDRPNTKLGITYFGIGAIVGWPFCAALLGPLLLDELSFLIFQGEIRGPLRRTLEGLATLFPFAILDIATNAIFYHRPVFSPWRIVSYNIFGGSSRGPDIFGTEPWHYYFRNLLLNFNAWFLLAILAIPSIFLQYGFQHHTISRLSSARTFVFALPFYLWLIIFTLQPHKEERFMYPAYPFLCLNAAIALHHLLSFLGHIASSKFAGKLKAMIVAMAMFAMILIGIIRTWGTVHAYSAPLSLYPALKEQAKSASTNTTICLGKEWYRYPSSFFIPPSMRLEFVKSEFDGLLPGHFSEIPGQFGLVPAWEMPSGMNDMNIEDQGKYVDIKTCDFLVDYQSLGSTGSPLEPAYIADTDTWKPLHCVPFLDSGKTHAIARVFWLPTWSILPRGYHRHWGQYCLLERRI